MELKVPPAGESISTVMISEWLLAEGDSISEDQTVVVLETDKINVEVPSPINGRLEKILKKAGEEAAIGEVIATLSAQAGKAPSAAPPVTTPEAKPAAAVLSPAALSLEAKVEPVVMPSARRVLEEAGVPAATVQGSGKDGRVLKEDALAYQKKAPAEAVAPLTSSKPSVVAAGSAAIAKEREEVVSMSPLRRKVAERLVAAQQTAAILTTFNEVDMTAIMSLRERYGKDFYDKHGIKLGFMSFFIKASIEALKAFPEVNAEIRANSIVYKNHYDIGVAVGGGKGLVVPVLRGADRMSFAEVELGVRNLAKKAKDMKLNLSDLEGGTFTISNGGIYGSMLSTPIINPPQSGILGLHNITERPVAVGGKVEIRPIMYLALSYDHRIIDGRGAVSFLVAVKKAIEDPTRLLLEV